MLALCIIASATSVFICSELCTLILIFLFQKFSPNMCRMVHHALRCLLEISHPTGPAGEMRYLRHSMFRLTILLLWNFLKYTTKDIQSVYYVCITSRKHFFTIKLETESESDLVGLSKHDETL